MKVYRAPYGVIRSAAREAELHADIFSLQEDCLSVRLRARSDGPYLVTASREQLPDRAVCIHGYEAFIEALLEIRPHAVVETQQTTYQGLADFDDRQDEIMARLEVLYADQECECA